MGRPRRATTERQMAASGTRRARLPVLAVTRRGSFDPALTMMVSGPGQNFSARRSKAESSWRGVLIGLGDLGDQERERLVTRPRLDVVDAVYRVEIDGVDGEAHRRCR